MTDPKFIKAALDKFSDNLNKHPDDRASYHAYDALDIDALLNSLYRTINAIENNPVSR
jgi:hypothetical protein